MLAAAVDSHALPSQLDQMMANVRRVAEIQRASLCPRHFETTVVAMDDLGPVAQPGSGDVCAREDRGEGIDVNADQCRSCESAASRHQEAR